MTGVETAKKWPFSKGYGYVDNTDVLTHIPTATTTTTIKQQKVNLMTNHSSRIAA